MAHKRILPSLTRLRSFEAAARHRSFKKAAEELGVTQSAVSHQIAALEAALDARLFARKPGGVELSETGMLYFPFLREAFDQIELGTDLIRRDGSRSSLTIQVYVTVAARWLIPQLHRFRSAHPDISIALDSSSMDWDFDPALADLGIVYTSKPTRAGVEYGHLFDSHLTLVASPTLAETIRKTADVAKCTALEVFKAPEDRAVWCAAAGPATARPAAIEKFDSYLLAIEAALDGQGVMVAPEFMVANDIAAGRLAEPTGITVAQPGGWYLAWSRRRRNDRSIRLFRKWLVDCADRVVPLARA